MTEIKYNVVFTKSLSSLNNLQVSYPTEQTWPQLPHEELPPLPGHPHHHTEVLLCHEGEDEPGELSGVDPDLQPGENVEGVSTLTVPGQGFESILFTEPAHWKKL